MTRMDLAAYVTGDLVDRGPGRWVTGIARLGVDGLATAGAMMLASYSAWATVDFWTVPLIWPDVAVPPDCGQVLARARRQPHARGATSRRGFLGGGGLRVSYGLCPVDSNLLFPFLSSHLADRPSVVADD